MFCHQCRIFNMLYMMMQVFGSHSLYNARVDELTNIRVQIRGNNLFVWRHRLFFADLVSIELIFLRIHLVLVCNFKDEDLSPKICDMFQQEIDVHRGHLYRFRGSYLYRCYWKELLAQNWGSVSKQRSWKKNMIPSNLCTIFKRHFQQVQSCAETLECQPNSQIVG